MKSFKTSVYGLVGSVLIVTIILVGHEIDPEATRALKRPTLQTTAKHNGVAPMTSSANKLRPIRSKPKINLIQMSMQARIRSSVKGTIPVSLTEGAIQEHRDYYYGVPVHGQNYVVIYNAVPKTASRAFFGAIRTAVRSSKNTRRVRVGSIKRRYRESRRDFFNFIVNVEPPRVLRGHVPFAGLPSRFLYINVVRDPMERFISEYYFMRNGDSRLPAITAQRSHGYNPEHLPEGWNDTLDECVRKGSALCLPDSGMLRLFCGFSQKCRTPSKWTFEQAKSNLGRYTMVGLTDDLEGSFGILERLLPDMTGELTAIFRNQSTAQEPSRYRTINRQEPMDSTKKVLRGRLSYEYEFYHLVRDEFYKLKESLDIS